MKKTVFFIFIPLAFVVAGFLIPNFFSPKISIEYKQGIYSAVEPFGIFYPGVKYSNKKISTDRCSDRDLKQILLQTYSWMFIPGPLVELCVYPNDPETIKSAGIIPND